jgi:hypothetical protein
MDPIITNYLSELEVGELQTFENMGIVPLFPSTNGGPVYALLKEALDERLITITEVGQSGSVPELRVVNTSPSLVLLIDGEELMGAKQNRVLNTSILLGGKSETVIPVSCTEQGRWRYTSPTFLDSDVIMSQRGRASKAEAVAASLHADRGFAADQSELWDHIQYDHQVARTSSPTRAMKDMFTSKSRSLNKYVDAFECLPRQGGSMVFVNGEPAGFDAISQEEAYASLHSKLVKSYAMDALLQRKDRFDEPSVDKARAFLSDAQECGESRFDSIGLGYDYRFDGARMVGSALVFEESVIHLAFFRLDKGGILDFMSGYRQRRGFRRSRT